MAKIANRTHTITLISSTLLPVEVGGVEAAVDRNHQRQLPSLKLSQAFFFFLNMHMNGQNLDKEHTGSSIPYLWYPSVLQSKSVIRVCCVPRSSAVHIPQC